MGQGPSGVGGPGKPTEGKDKEKPEKKKWEPPVAPRIGKKKIKRGPSGAFKLPNVVPVSKCKLRLSRLERVKDYLILEEEFIKNQENIRPAEEKHAGEK